jgi:hypothetical protein
MGLRGEGWGNDEHIHIVLTVMALGFQWLPMKTLENTILPHRGTGTATYWRFFNRSNMVSCCDLLCANRCLVLARMKPRGTGGPSSWWSPPASSKAMITSSSFTVFSFPSSSGDYALAEGAGDVDLSIWAWRGKYQRGASASFAISLAPLSFISSTAYQLLVKSNLVYITKLNKSRVG